MKLSLASLCFIFLLFLTALAAAQNNAYSSYYTYTVVYNADGSANVTPTAEVSGIDDVSDWVEGSYRPVCTVRPKIQLNGDGVWVGGTRVALGRAVDQVHTGQSVYVPANGSTVGLDFAVEADVACSGVPNPTYYQYPTLAYLGSWSNIDFYFWSLEGFEPAQYAPPYYIAYSSNLPRELWRSINQEFRRFCGFLELEGINKRYVLWSSADEIPWGLLLHTPGLFNGNSHLQTINAGPYMGARLS